MSYARFDHDSDVYVFMDLQGRYECCACGLADDHVTFATPGEIVAHLDDHVEAGHAVPERAFDALQAEQAAVA